jgi:hypothetical protein
MIIENACLHLTEQYQKPFFLNINFQGPKYGSIFVSQKRKFNFTLNDVEQLQVSYKQPKSQGQLVDYVVFAVVSPYTGIAYTSLLKLNMEPMQNDQILSDTSTYQTDESGPHKKSYKAIYVIPGEAVKITSSELKPTNFYFDQDRLIYSLVSGKPKFGNFNHKDNFRPLVFECDRKDFN